MTVSRYTMLRNELLLDLELRSALERHAVRRLGEGATARELKLYAACRVRLDEKLERQVAKLVKMKGRKEADDGEGEGEA